MNEYLFKKKSIAVIGLGYVGLPLALNFAKYYNVIGFDINAGHIQKLKQHYDPNGELSKEEFENCDIEFTSDEKLLFRASFFIIAVPTPIDEFKKPDLRALLSATQTIAKFLKKNDIVVYESTVYPGCTEEECVPILEKISGLKFPTDFKVGYSPERINPGDKEHTFTRIKKVVAGCDSQTTDFIAQIYGQVVQAGIFRASSIKVAEAAKIIENTQRDVNIGLMNELSIIFQRMGINTFEVLEAARTKWNFLNFTPGLVGGHCIGVDPYYLAFKAARLGYHPQIINSGRFINDAMPAYVAKNIVRKLISKEIDIKNAKILILGITFKENISDIRNSKVIDLVKEIKSFGITHIFIADPRANSEMIKEEYNLQLINNFQPPYDVLVLAVPHTEYKNFDIKTLKNFLGENGIFFDLKGIYYKFANQFDYWSL